MATGGQKEIGYNLADIGTLTLGLADLDPWGIIVIREMLMITDRNTCKVHVYRRHDGMLLSTSDRLEAIPYGMCLINDMEICVALGNGKIEFMTVDDTGRIKRGKQFNLQTTFDDCDGVGRFKDKVVVCGVKNETIRWCIASLEDGHVDEVHNICKGLVSFMTIKDTMMYISCHAVSLDSSCVYGYNIMNPRQQPFTYKHGGVWTPRGITVDDKGFLFLCDFKSIRHLTDKCQVVTKYGIPSLIAIFWDNEILYVTSWNSNVIHRYKVLYPHQQDPVIPVEILRMDDESLQLYKNALQDGKEKVYNIRVMVVGQYGVGKTTLTKRLLGQKVDISERKSTDGIDVHKHCCKISLDTGEWIVQAEDSDQLSRLQRLMTLLSGPDQKPDVSQEQEGHSGVIYERETTFEVDSINNNDTAASSGSDINQEVHLISSQHPAELGVNKMDERHGVEHSDQNTSNVAIPVSETKSSESEKKDAVMEIIHLINKNAEKLQKDIVKYAALSMWDFAGQYAYYTTHQTFLSRRAIYLLVIDINQQVVDLIEDDKFFFDTEGIKLCKVHELIEIWLNSIHTCASSPEASIPNVILVGTHVDKLSEDKRQEIIDMYFPQICHILNDKPTLRHVVKFFAIDNTKLDPQLDSLKTRIYQLASEQPYWGEEVPSSWLPMEEALMKLKASGKKVIPRSLVEELNQAASVPIKTAEQLDLFLRFQHEIGTILYFSVDGLKEKIVLDPQWFINALKSLITAEMFILEKYPAIRSKWFELKNNGRLTPELIDAVWTKDNNPEFYENKEHMLVVMEKLNIIAKPRSYIKDTEEFKEEDYYIAPCMLSNSTPKQIICPESNPQKESTSVLCFVSTGKFLPPPVFHRLLAACVSHWQIATQKQKRLIFCGCCVFDLDHHHRMTLHFKDYIIFARITRMGATDMDRSSKLCSEARKFIFENLMKIIGNLGQTLQFELHIKCPDSDADSLEGLIAVSLLQKNEKLACHDHDNSHVLASQELLKFWFEEEQKMAPVGQMSIGASHLTPLEECQLPLGRRVLPPGKKYHIFFSYSSSDMQWVKKTLETLENDHGFVCCEYERDNTPGTPLLTFASDSIRNAYKTVVVMTSQAFQSGFVLYEIEMAIIQGFNEKRKCVVPVLLEDCEVPAHLNVLNYIDARDPMRRDIWWPKFITELETQGEQDKRQEVISMYFPQICRILNDKPALCHVVEFVPIDNTHVDHQLETLKEKIFQLASEQPYWGEEVPSSWLPMEGALMKLKASGKKIIPRSLVEELNQAASVPIRSAEQLDLFLRFQHEMGTILYFSVDELKEKIVLDPQWFIDALKSLITAETFILKKYPTIRSKWFEFKDNGKLTPELIGAVWTKDNNPEFYENKEHMLVVMEKLNIIAKPKSYIENREESKEEDYYIAPCMLSNSTPKEIICPESNPQKESTSVLCFVSTGKFLPPPVFHRLLAACVSHWQIATQRQKRLIFCGCCVFDLDDYHRMTLHFKDYIIFARIIKMGVTDMDRSSMLCSEARKFIFENLMKIIGNLGQSLQFELHIKCPDSDADSLEGLIAVSHLQKNEKVACHAHDNSHILASQDLLKFWFEEEQEQEIEQRESSGSEQDQEEGGQDNADTPITQEHINHARLCNTLTTVCADALREILINQVPIPYANIYQAILANETNLTRKLNNDQRDVVFPDTRGTTGTVDQFDTSLLYTIIRNVSSVPAPTTGWGNPPVDQPRDTSLGASVERIRLYRNKVSGHSVEGKISETEFKDYWKKIDDVLHDIESVIGVQGYQIQLEKRKSQAITPYEAHQLQKQFQEYKKQLEAAAADIQSALETALSAVKILKR